MSIRFVADTFDGLVRSYNINCRQGKVHKAATQLVAPRKTEDRNVQLGY